MLRNVLLLSLASAAAAFAPSGGILSLRRAPQRAACGLRMQASAPAVKMTHGWFTQLGDDGSGRIDVNELKMALGDAKDVSAMMERADLDGMQASPPARVKMTHGWFTQLDVDGSGRIDVNGAEDGAW